MADLVGDCLHGGCARSQLQIDTKRALPHRHRHRDEAIGMTQAGLQRAVGKARAAEGIAPDGDRAGITFQQARKPDAARSPTVCGEQRGGISGPGCGIRPGRSVVEDNGDISASGCVMGDHGDHDERIDGDQASTDDSEFHWPNSPPIRVPLHRLRGYAKSRRRWSEDLS